MARPPIRGTGLSCIFLPSGKSISQLGPTFMRKVENQTVNAKDSVNGARMSMEKLTCVQNTLDSVNDLSYDDFFIELFFYFDSPPQSHLSSLIC